jgi:hypothetical protein
MVGTGSISQQDFVIDDYALLLCFVVERLKVFRLGFEIIIGHAGLGLNHRDCPYRTFGIRRVASRSAEICECSTYGDAGNKNHGFVHIYRLLWLCSFLQLGIHIHLPVAYEMRQNRDCSRPLKDFLKARRSHNYETPCCLPPLEGTNPLLRTPILG